MRTFVRGTNVKVTEAMKSYAEERLDRMNRHSPFLREATLVYSIQRAWHIAEVTVRFGETIMRAEERSNDMYVSVDKAVDKIDQQVKRLKGRIEARRHAARERGEVDESAEQLAEILAEVDAEEGIQALGDGEVVKIKSYQTKPMSTEEALLQMHLVDHDFFVFVQTSGEVNVLYRRKDGDYGLLQPESAR